MGNPALAEFQEKFAEQLADALFDEAGHHPDRAALLRAVETATAGWRAKRKRTMIRDASGRVQDGADLAGPVDDPITHIVRLTVSTHIDRDETPEEIASHKERLTALLWEPEQGPPPKGVGGLQLLDQDTWWIPKDSAPIRVVDMAGSHARNLAAFLRRNAARYKNREWHEMMWSMTGPLGPSGEMAQDAAESELNRLEDADPLAWLSEKPLLRVLIPTVYLWQIGGRAHGKVSCHAIHEDGEVIASFVHKRRREALAAIQPPTAEQAYRGLFGGVGPAFYHLVILPAGEPLPEATRIALEEEVDE